MKELDVLLERFLETKYDGLDNQGKQAFAALLQHEDPDLYAWLVGQDAPAGELKDVIESIRG
jgi:antitoxin CptB